MRPGILNSGLDWNENVWMRTWLDGTREWNGRELLAVCLRFALSEGLGKCRSRRHKYLYFVIEFLNFYFFLI